MIDSITSRPNGALDLRRPSLAVGSETRSAKCNRGLVSQAASVTANGATSRDRPDLVARASPTARTSRARSSRSGRRPSHAIACEPASNHADATSASGQPAGSHLDRDLHRLRRREREEDRVVDAVAVRRERAGSARAQPSSAHHGQLDASAARSGRCRARTDTTTRVAAVGHRVEQPRERSACPRTGARRERASLRAARTRRRARPSRAQPCRAR